MNYENILPSWKLKFLRERPEIDIVGSPERCEFRMVVECKQGLYILEQIKDSTIKRKSEINKALTALSSIESVHPYIHEPKHIIQVDGANWQLMPFIKGIDLPRPDYIHDAWRGRELGKFLCQMWNKAAHRQDSFDIFSYIDQLLKAISYNKELVHKLAPVIESIADLRKEYAGIPTKFCHGDFHPINVIWGDKKINAVIDWEFFGEKPELYDIANMVGCVGFEHPSGLDAELVHELLNTIKKEVSSLSLLPEFVIALRFAWVSEWLRKKDSEMLELEFAYLNILMDNKEVLRKKWSN